MVHSYNHSVQRSYCSKVRGRCQGLVPPGTRSVPIRPVEMATYVLRLSQPLYERKYDVCVYRFSVLD